MQIGCLGDIVFEVSDKIIHTLDEVTWSGSVSIHTHTRHLDNSLQEFVNIDPDKISFKITLSKYLGVDPMEEITKIFAYERSGVALPLTIGTKAYGKYRWLIADHKAKLENYDKLGNVTVATVDITLAEYLRE